MIEEHKKFITKASRYLDKICSAKPNRRTGSPGNRDAADYFENKVRQLGYAVDNKPFKCMDYRKGRVLLSFKKNVFDVYTSPYSLGCDIRAELATVSTLEELEKISCKNKILLMKDDICSEQLMPKNFIFYNPDHHKKIYTLLEEKRPAAIITATTKKPELVGALYPFPLIVDGDFDISSVYCTDIIGKEIAVHTGEMFKLTIQAERIPSTANNVIARKNQKNKEKIIVCAHIDAYEDTPGASDNASGTVVLLLLAEMLQDYDKSLCIELVAFNGEDHYSAGGQMDYLSRYGSELRNILLVFNVDDVGYKKGKTAFSFYGCTDEIQQRLRYILNNYDGLIEGEQWYNGDHMIFVQKGKPALALTSEKMQELMAAITHTEKDTPNIIDTAKLVETARVLKDVIINLEF
jgi:aminopeptidase YwaD